MAYAIKKENRFIALFDRKADAEWIARRFYSDARVIEIRGEALRKLERKVPVHQMAFSTML